MPINASYQRPPWVPPPHESSAGTVIPQLFAQGLARGQQQHQHEDEQQLREEEALRQQQVHERTTALASRRFAATAAFQDAMRRDLAMAETQVANLGEAVDEDTMSQIAARNFLLYGAAMNEGGGGSGGGLSSFIGRQQTAGYRDAQLAQKDQQLDQRNISLAQGEARLQNAGKALVIQEGNQALRRSMTLQSATSLEAKLLQDGMKPTVSGAPPGTLPPDASGNPPPTGLVARTTRPPTTANVTKHQESLSNSIIAMRQIKQVGPLVNASTGPRAWLEDIVVDRGLANVFPELVGKDRVKGGVLLGVIRASVQRSLRTDGNIAEPEREELKILVPGPAELLTSPAKAYEQLMAIQGTLMEKSIQAARQLKEPLPDDALPFLPTDEDEIRDLLKAGVITPDQVRTWHQSQTAR